MKIMLQHSVFSGTNSELAAIFEVLFSDISFTFRLSALKNWIPSELQLAPWQNLNILAK